MLSPVGDHTQTRHREGSEHGILIVFDQHRHDRVGPNPQMAQRTGKRGDLLKHGRKQQIAAHSLIGTPLDHRGVKEAETHIHRTNLCTQTA
ncbi:MAG: hypothetical protein R2709_08835 [Marmoricola sp.]